jgi:hypothetical protein
MISKALIVAMSGFGNALDAQLPTSAPDPLAVAGTWFEGVMSIPDSQRVRIATDKRTTDLIHRVLTKQGPAPREFNRAVAVWWLAESGRGEYVPTLLAVARDSAAGDAFTFAVYGLARHTELLDVRSYLMDLVTKAAPDVRATVASALTIVNDSSSRNILRGVERRGFTRQLSRRIDRALARPARAVGSGLPLCDRKSRTDPIPAECDT